MIDDVGVAAAAVVDEFGVVAAAGNAAADVGSTNDPDWMVLMHYCE